MIGEEGDSDKGRARRELPGRMKAAVHDTVERARRARSQVGHTITDSALLKQTRATASTVGHSAATKVGAAVRTTVAQARRVGSQLGHTLREGGEYVQLTRTSHTLRKEMDDRFRAIGRRVFALSKRARGEKPFGRFKLIMDEVDKIDGLEKRFTKVRARLGEVRRDLRRRGR